MPNPLLTRRALVLAKVESNYNEDPVPTPAANAVLVEDPDYTTDITILERDFVQDTLSPQASVNGRKLAGISFGVELRSNGSTNSGLIADAPIMGTLLRACGFSETAILGVGCVSAENAHADNAGVVPVFGSAGGESTYNEPIDLTATVVLGGASATATVRVTGGDGGLAASFLRSEVFTATTTSAAGTIVVDASDPLAVDFTFDGTWVVGDVIVWNIGGFKGTTTATGTTGTAVGDDFETDSTAAHADITGTNTTGTVAVTFANDMAGEVITTADTDIDLAGSGSTVQMTWSGSLTIGDAWDLTVNPKCIRYDPISTGFESVTLYGYFDGLLHKITGCFGTFSIAANSGEYAKVQFNFTGQFIAPTDIAVPSGSVFETVLPPQWELARLRVDQFAAVVASFSYDQANAIEVREDANSSDGYNGTRITAREPTGGIDPETTLVADEDFWAKLAASTQMPFQTRFGTVSGNIVHVRAPSTNYTGLTYSDRSGIRVYDAGLKFNSKYGDDEVAFIFS